MEKINNIIEKVSPFTMVSDDSLIELAYQVSSVLTFKIPGEFVECGVWRGGASFLMAEIIKLENGSDRKVWLLDSFEGLPPPSQLDGPRAREYAKNTDDDWFLDNCTATFEEVKRAAKKLGLEKNTVFVKGWFEETLPKVRHKIGPIAILRIDADWYKSVKICLEYLFDLVVEGGLIIIDDYYTWDGCTLAVHEFLGKRGISYPIECVIGKKYFPSGEFKIHYDENLAAVIKKDKKSWEWTRKCYLVLQDILSINPFGNCIILADQEQLGIEKYIDSPIFPFLEKNGEYWGMPADSEIAIQDIERLRSEGARFIFFAWPVFWCLDYYSEMSHYLKSRFDCVLKNERVIAFDLR